MAPTTQDLVAKVRKPITEIVVYCKAGGRAALATQTLQQLGYSNVASIARGLRPLGRRGRGHWGPGREVYG